MFTILFVDRLFHSFISINGEAAPLCAHYSTYLLYKVMVLSLQSVLPFSQSMHLFSHYDYYYYLIPSMWQRLESPVRACVHHRVDLSCIQSLNYGTRRIYNQIYRCLFWSCACVRATRLYQVRGDLMWAPCIRIIPCSHLAHSNNTSNEKLDTNAEILEGLRVNEVEREREWQKAHFRCESEWETESTSGKTRNY